MITLRNMLIDSKISADGRDNAIALIAKNIPRSDVRFGTNSRTLKFMEVSGRCCDQSNPILIFIFSGVRNLMEVASYGYCIEKSPIPISSNTRLNCSVALSKLYDDLMSDQNRNKWNEHCQVYIQ